MPMKSLEDLYLDELKDTYSAESQILRALPKMARKAKFPELRAAFEEHLEQTRGHVQRLDQIFQELGRNPRGKKCKGMEGLIEEGSELMQEEADPSVMDAGMISAAQRVEHYE
ncbi:MAG: ferritin-like domain-containing protein, partial [Chloroflexi bacterium]|nr:ferritin-like domain-containing protein [Chloroflexota bacterium]